MIKQQAIRGLRVLGELFPIDLLANATGQKFVAPFYHTVSDEILPHIRHLYRYRSVSEFEKDLDQMLAVYEPVTAEGLHRLILEGRLAEKKRMFLSFDDGLRECCETIAPILERKGVPATFFINSAFIGNKGLMYRYKASLLIDKLEDSGKSSLRELAQLLNLCNYEKANVVQEVLNLRYSNKELLDIAANILSLSFSDFLTAVRPYMTATEIKDLQKRGFNIGAHSIDHPLYSQFTEEEQHEQTTKSIAEVKNLFEPTINSFAYPFTDHGVSGSFIWGTLEHEADLTFGTAGIKQDIHPRHVQRIPMEGNKSDGASILKGEYLYYLLKAPFGKNMTART